jgi:hypothetical protein
MAYNGTVVMLVDGFNAYFIDPASRNVHTSGRSSNFLGACPRRFR